MLILDCLLENISFCYNDPNKSSTTKIKKHTPSGYSLSTHCSFDNTKNIPSYYRGQECTKMLSKDLKKDVEGIIYWKKKKLYLQQRKGISLNENEKHCYIYKKRFTKDNKKVRDHCHFPGKYRGTAHNKCNMNYKITKDVPVIFHNVSTYDYDLIIKELVKEFDGEFECLRENTEKYITFSISINKKITKKIKRVMIRL